jgi:hypothetical protein
MRIRAGWGPVLDLVVLATASFASILAQDVTFEKQKIDPFQTALVLNAGREYCRRLESAALDFVCQEEVLEKIDLSRDHKPDVYSQMPTPETGMPGTYPRSRFSPSPRDGGKASSIENSYLFDYQFLRRAGEITEKRVLLEKNGKKAREKDAPTETSTFRYADILLAPVRLLDERFGEYYDYRLLREDTLDGVKAWVLDVVPRLAIVDAYLGGQIWLDQADSSILRIDWDPSTFGSYENILRRAKAYQAQPLVTSLTWFGIVKNGIRFPSVDLTEEAYQDRQGGKFVRAVTKVVYKDYRFFTVETETEFKK